MQSETRPKGCYNRGYLPHVDIPGIKQLITFRLADSLPSEKLRLLELELELMPKAERRIARQRSMDAWLDAGMGCCAFRHPQLAAVMKESLLSSDGCNYHLLSWCVMPNHVHVLIEPAISLPRIVQSWKSYTGRWAMTRNTELGLGVPGRQFWMRDYWDRYVRDQAHFDAAVAYIHNNPVSAGLCKQAGEWPWSSASGNRSL